MPSKKEDELMMILDGAGIPIMYREEVAKELLAWHTKDLNKRVREARIDEIYYWFNRYSNGRVAISNQLPVSTKVIKARIATLKSQEA